MEHEDLIATFDAYLDAHRYPGSVVCETVNASQADTTQWRLKGLIPTDGYVKRGRLYYTGVQVLRMGVIAELAPIIGPAKASKIADHYFTNRKPDWRAFDGKALLYNPNTAGQAFAEWAGGSPLGISLRDEAQSFGVLNSATVVLPLGRLVRQWMIGAELRLQAVEA